MRRQTARVLGLVLALGLVLLRPAYAQTERTVYLGCNLADDRLLAFTIAAGGQPGVVLLDTPQSARYLGPFLDAFRPDRIVPVGGLPNGSADLERRLGRKMAPALAWDGGPPAALWREWFPAAEQVVVCPPEPRGMLLQAACLAGTVRAPLFILSKGTCDTEQLRHWLAEWHTRKVFACGAASSACEGLRDVYTVALADEAAVAAAHRRQLLVKGPIETLVLANPADRGPGLGGTSSLAPWIAVRRRAALLLTNDKGDNATELLRTALAHRDLRRADALILAANLKAIPMERRDNPVPGKDTHIEMEPLTPPGYEPFTLATGRLFHEDLGILPLLLARQQLLPPDGSPRQALVVSNPGGGLPLLELFSRSTTAELRNAGYETASFFGEGSTKPEEVRRLLPGKDIFLWEGHYRTMIDEYGVPSWDEPLRPGLVFLQSCLALNEAEAPLFLRRGALAVVGSSTRTYSGTGGAFSLAFFDAMLYERQSLGSALRQAKNYLLAYALLKEKRLGDDAKLGGASLRSAWAFSLWGDPTLKLPRPAPPAKALTPVRHEVRGNTLVLLLPDQWHDEVITSGYQVQKLANARLAGLLTRSEDEDNRRLVPLLFAEFDLPRGQEGKTPRLRSRVPERSWVFCWDARRRCGYLLVRPRAKDEGELRFHIDWLPGE
jgi:hypothetical protein